MAAHDLMAVPVPCSSEVELKNRLKQLLSVSDNIETACSYLFDKLIEDVLLGLVFECHYISRQGGIPVMTEEDSKTFAVVESNETDIFGQQYVKKSQDCFCPSCSRPLSASRFAPHLEKCLGMGRNSSRIASRRIANNCKENAYGGASDDDDDDWMVGQDKSKLTKKIEGKKKKDKNGVKKSKTPKIINDKHQNGKVTEDFSQSAKYENVESKN